MKRNLILTIAAAMALVFALGAGQSLASGTTGADWKFHDIVNVSFVEKHVTVPPSGNVMIIDSRPKRAKYDKGHIPGAVSIPDLEFDKHVAKLPEDKNTLLIYYCGGVKCKLSHKSAKKAEALGYTNVKVFSEGFPGWMAVPGHYAEVSTEWVKAQMDSNAPMMIIDARPKQKKYATGHIPGAMSLPDSQFDKLQGQLPADKDWPLVFYCGGFKCKLSHKSAAKAMALGYKNVKVYAAGYPAWVAMYGKGDTAMAAASVQGGAEEGSIDVDAFKKILSEKPESVYLVDVRDPDEFATGSLKTAMNIPVDKLEDKLPGLATDKPIIYICGTGARSGESYYMTKDLRPEIKDVYYLDAELTVNKDGSFSVKKAAN